MLAVAHNRVPGTLVQADARTLPFGDGSVDVTTAVTLLEFADGPEQIIAELLRVTRPGGLVAVATLNPCSPWGLAQRRALRRPPWSQACLRTRAQLHRLLSGHGDLRLHSALYSPGAFPRIHAVGPLLERTAPMLPELGAFQVGVITRPST